MWCLKTIASRAFFYIVGLPASSLNFVKVFSQMTSFKSLSNTSVRSGEYSLKYTTKHYLLLNIKPGAQSEKEMPRGKMIMLNLEVTQVYFYPICHV